MDSVKQRIEILISKELRGKISIEEAYELNTWYNANQNIPIVIPATFCRSERKLRKRIFSGITAHLEKKPGFKLLPYTVAAASLLVCLGIALHFSAQKPAVQQVRNQNDVAPGSNNAVLTLADGKKINLKKVKSGEITKQSGIKVTKTAAGQLNYTASPISTKPAPINDYNTVETPKGGTYQVILPDGTKVWLNAASALRFPVSFATQKERRVVLLSGEAYFEVARDKKHPFIVNTDSQQIEVLGTHFNISNYKDESYTKTTLVEGSLRIIPVDKAGKQQQAAILRPNEQAILCENILEVSLSDTEEATAWKYGYFKFENESIESVMRKIARWYNVKIEYSGSIPKRGLGGTMSRGRNLSKVLEMLQKTGLVKFTISGNTVTVSK